MITTGTTTSGCVRATAVDAAQYNFHSIVPEECVWDRGELTHKVNLFDIQMKYGDVKTTDEVIEYLRLAPQAPLRARTRRPGSRTPIRRASCRSGGRSAAVSLEIRKVVTVVEEVRTDGGRSDGEPLRKAATAVVFRNPYAGREFSEDLSELVEPSAELGTLIGERCVAALGVPVESHGKAVMVGTAGEQEHGNAVKTTTFGNPFREAFGGGRAWLPSTTKRCAPGASVDVPLCFKDEIWVRSHYDTITLSVADAPAPDEIVLIGAVASRGRLNARLGGKTKEEALAELEDRRVVPSLEIHNLRRARQRSLGEAQARRRRRCGSRTARSRPSSPRRRRHGPRCRRARSPSRA